MSTVAFDTLKLSRKLESAGFTHEQAVGAAEALAETFDDTLATKREMKDLEVALKRDLKGLEVALKGDIELLRRDLTIRLGGMLVVAVGAFAALVKLL